MEVKPGIIEAIDATLKEVHGIGDPVSYALVASRPNLWEREVARAAKIVAEWHEQRDTLKLCIPCADPHALMFSLTGRVPLGVGMTPQYGEFLGQLTIERIHA